MSQSPVKSPITTVSRREASAIGARIGATTGLVLMVIPPLFGLLVLGGCRAMGPKLDAIAERLAMLLKPRMLSLYFFTCTGLALVVGIFLGILFALLIRGMRSRGHTHSRRAILLGALWGLLSGAVLLGLSVPILGSDTLFLSPLGSAIGAWVAWRIDARLLAAEGGVDHDETEQGATSEP